MHRQYACDGCWSPLLRWRLANSTIEFSTFVLWNTEYLGFLRRVWLLHVVVFTPVAPHGPAIQGTLLVPASLAHSENRVAAQTRFTLQKIQWYLTKSVGSVSIAKCCPMHD